MGKSIHPFRPTHPMHQPVEDHLNLHLCQERPGASDAAALRRKGGRTRPSPLVAISGNRSGSVVFSSLEHRIISFPYGREPGKRIPGNHSPIE